MTREERHAEEVPTGRVEYRVVYDVREGRRTETYELPLADPASKAEACSRLTKAASSPLFGRRYNWRIEERAVAVGPWVESK